MRDHEGQLISTFNGLFDRGDPENTPIDHFQACTNVRYKGLSVLSREGISISQDVLAQVPLANIRRIYNFPQIAGNTLIILVYDPDADEGKIYHIVSGGTVFGPILTITGMQDFAFQPYAGRGYISPIGFIESTFDAPPPIGSITSSSGSGVDPGDHSYKITYITDEGETTPSSSIEITVVGGSEIVNLSEIPVPSGGCITGKKIYRTEAGGSDFKFVALIPPDTTTYDDSTPDSGLGSNAPTTNTAIRKGPVYSKGIEGEFLYVYAGDGTPARKAAGQAIGSGMVVAAGAAGHTDAGLHIYGVVSETISGYLSPPGSLTTFTNIPANSVSFGSIPTSGDPNVVKRHIVASKAITDFNGDVEGYQLFFIPGATINDNTSTFLNNISFFDADLLEDASHLFDNYSEIPAGAVLTLYHNRLVLTTTFDDVNVAIVSAVGEPEAFSQIDGFLAVQPDGNYITNASEFRDVLYIFKSARTVSFTDNGDAPSTWPAINVDLALGTCLHGIATVLDSGGTNVDFLIVCTNQGVSLFTGGFQVPELSWKIENFWRGLNKNNFNRIQIINSPIEKRIYIVLPGRYLLVGFYQNGMNPKDMQWSPYTFAQPINTVAITNTDEIILGSDIY